jgi:signal transduction histidine kinase
VTSATPSPLRRTRFAAAEVERAYRQARLRDDSRITAIAFLILALDVAIFAVTDRAVLGATPRFWWLLAVRAGSVATTVLALLWAHRSRSVQVVDRIHLGLAGLFAAITWLVDLTRPASYVLFVVPELGLIYAAWVFFSVRFAFQAAAALVFTTATVATLAFYRAPLPASGYLAIAVAYASAHVIGAISSWRLQRARRMEWLRGEELARAHQQSEEASRAKSVFLGMVSHEILAPLGGIVASAEGLLRRPTPGGADAELEAIRSEGAALHALLTDVLDLARGDVVAPVVERRAAEPWRILADVAQALSGLAEAKGLELRAEVAPDVPRQLSIDPGRIRQVLLNLGANALRCTRRGGVSLRGALRPGADGGLWLAFQVEDTGPGIAPERLAEIFEPFWRAPAAALDPGGKAGVGLAVARLLAQRMGGVLEVTSAPGQGSCFTLAVPALRVAPEARQVEEAPADDQPVLAEPALAEEARALAEVPHAARARALAERAAAAAVAGGDAGLARWAERVRERAAALDARGLVAELRRLAPRATDS